MNPFIKLLSLAALTLAPVAGYAADSESLGTVEGRVQNAVTGRYLAGVRIAVQGREAEAFTDQFGSYRLTRLPAGPAVITVFYTGLDPAQATVAITSGQTTVQDFSLSNVARYGEAEAAVRLDAFVVNTARETDAATLAINEQRFAPNIKNVVATDALGDIMDGQVGEFLKFLPGVTPVYDAENGGAVSSVAVRGLPTSMTVISADGLEMANSGNPLSNSRVFQFKDISINNISRLEVTKVPTPSAPADSMAGSIDMISKSAFERKNAEFRYSVSLSGPMDRLEISRQPHLSGGKVHTVRPSYTFDYTLPVSRNFGLVVTGQSQDRYLDQHRASITYLNAGTATGATPERPYLQQYEYRTEPRVNTRRSLALRLDWRPHAHGVLSLNVERSRFISDRYAAAITFNAGNNGTPTVAGGTALSFGPDAVTGATGRGGISLMNGGAAVVQQLDGKLASLRYRFDDGTWRIGAGFSASESAGGYSDTPEGRFRLMASSLRGPIRIAFRDITSFRPETVQVFDNSNREIDWRDLANYQLNTGFSSPRPVRDTLVNAKLDVRRTLPLSFPAAVQVGGLSRVKLRDPSVGSRRGNITYDYLGPDGIAGTPDAPVPFALGQNLNAAEAWGWRDMPWLSVRKGWDSFVNAPAQWAFPASRQVAAEQSRLQEAQRVKEQVRAFYVQGEASLLGSRLRVVTGVRFESTAVNGEGALIDPDAVWVRNADGSFARAANGTRIRKPEAGASGSMEQLRLTTIERGFRTRSTYDGFYPSLHLTYTARENLLVRAAYARTYGRPDFNNLFPRTSLTEVDRPSPGQIPGTITLTNTGLKPWTADNYDLSLEYYTKQGGLFSVGVFRKEIADFFGREVRLATPANLDALGLDPGYAGWNLTTSFNLAGKTRVDGVELNARHALAALGRWGRHLEVFANGTSLHLQGSNDADFSDFVPKGASWGITYSRRPFVVVARWNYRGQQRNGAVPAFGAGGYEYIVSRTTFDVNLDYQLRPNLTLYLNGQNLSDEPEYRERYSSVTPQYARPFRRTTYGAQVTLGIKGSF